MQYDAQAGRFRGMVHRVAEEDCQASVTDDDAQGFLNELYQRYIADGKPSDMRDWIRQALKSEFGSVGKPPVWVESRPNWPFFAGQPMLFLGQIDVPANKISEERAAPGSVLYLFGARKQVADGWEMTYRVVEQSG